MQEYKFSKDFLFGTATAALQIEGGDKNNNWYDWSEQGRIDDGSHSVVACDHWNRWEEDVDLITKLNNQTYRLGLEWSRIEPQKGRINYEALKVYRAEIELLIQNNIKPLVTIWHFSNPLWIEKAGGWINPDNVKHYIDFVKLVVGEFGDVVSDWITLNEPNVYLMMAYFEGTWPPGKQGDMSSYLKGAKNFIQAHLEAYQLIHELRKDEQKETKVGVAHHLRIFEPLNNSWLEKKSINLIKRFFQGIFLEGMTHGHIVSPLRGQLQKGNYADFIGINYYSRDIIKGTFDPRQLFGKRLVKEGAALNNLGWEIYPEGIYKIAKEIYSKYNLPIFITENGTCDKNDDFRTKYIRDHLIYLHKAIKEGIDIQRYYHWTLMDNFEWTEGNSARFGLYHNNFETQERTLRNSGAYYAKICKNKMVKD